MARLEMYIMTVLQQNPEYRNGTVGQIREKLNSKFNLSLTNEDVEAALLHIKLEGGEEDGIKEDPEDFEMDK